MPKLLNFDDSGTIVGRLSSPNAVKYYQVLQTRTIPFYNSISDNNTALPTEVDLALMMQDDRLNEGTCGIKALQRIVSAVWELRFKDALARAEVLHKDANAPKSAKDKKEVKAEVKASDTTLETQVAMLTELVAQLVDSK